jgi:peptide-methionine (S)-S-oxide reductase
VIFYHDEAQKAAAEKSMAKAQADWPSRIVTEISPLTRFHPAEEYHQDYYRNNSNQGYCRIVIKPKVDKVEKKLKAVK